MWLGGVGKVGESSLTLHLGWELEADYFCHDSHRMLLLIMSPSSPIRN